MLRVCSDVRRASSSARSFAALLPAGFLAAAVLLLTACGGGGEASSDAPPAQDPPATGAPAASAEDPSIEMEYWQSVKDTNDPDQLLAYIKKYPDGKFVDLAEARLKNMTDPNLLDPNVAGPGASNVDPPTQQSSSQKSPPPRLSNRDVVLDVVRRSLGRYGDPRLHIYPNIPRVKADNAASVHGMDPRSILVLYDDGLGSGGKTGFVLTDRRVYWRFVAGDQPYYLDYRDIQSAIARKNKFLLNGYDVPTTLSSDSRYAAQVYADLMMELRRAFR